MITRTEPGSTRATHTLAETDGNDRQPQLGVWGHMKNSLGNLAARDPDQLAAIVKHRLKSIQYRPALIQSFLAQTRLTLEPEPS